MGNNGIYLDYNATTPVLKEVLDAMLPFFSHEFGNAASRTHAYGWQALDAVNHARQQVAALIGAEENEIVFTSGATEAINLAIKGVYEAYRSKGNHIITCATEHKAVLDTCKKLESLGARVTVLPVNTDGQLDMNDLSEAITNETILVAIMMANNETGVVQPLRDIARITHEANALFFSDTTQAIGKLKVDVNDEGIDLCCLSAHKFYGPKGAGALYVRRKKPRVSLIAQIDGGGHENGRRSGTLNVPGIAGMGKAAEIAARDFWDDAQHMSVLRTQLEQCLIDFGNISVNGSTRFRLPNTTSLCFSGRNASEIIKAIHPVAVATGSACSSALPEPSHVLTAMGLTEKDAYASIRFSLGKMTTEEEITDAIEKIKRAVGG